VERDFAATPWEPLPPSDRPLNDRSWKSVLIGAAAIFLVIVLGFAGWYALVASISGRVVFGTGSAGCALDGQGSTFGVGTPVYAAVTLDRGVAPGANLTAVLASERATVQQWRLEVESLGTCFGELISPGLLAPGRYTLIYREGDEVLAEGEFLVIDVT
jgi:hypothetical protein